ncbi:MAG: PQQ-binding-like beta-propeller repeat protein [Planctomycetota bacterium]
MARRKTVQPVPLKRSPRRQLVTTLVVLVLLVVSVIAARWYWRRAVLDRVVRQGLELLTNVDTTDQTVAALDEWQRRTARRWQPRRDDLIVHLYSRFPLGDRRVRALLTRVAGVDYGDRLADWRRWFKNHQRLQRGRQPEVSSKERITLIPKWHAPIGLTGWFSTIIPLDGQIYVASLGATFDDEYDRADGLVRVDGQNGQATLIFEPPDGRLRDVLGIAAGDDCLFVAVRGGWIYCVEPDGNQRWSGHVGELLGGPPLSIDINHDGIADVIAVTHTGRVVAFSGHTGRTVWVTPAQRGGQRARGSGRVVGAAMAAGELDGNRVLSVTLPDGNMRILSIRNGQVCWEGRTMAGSLSGPLFRGQRAGVVAAIFIADRTARIWSVTCANNHWVTTPAWDLYTWQGESVIGGLRTLARDNGPPLLMACPTSSTAGYRAAVCALDVSGLHWRYAPRGAIWATPALADINKNSQTEIVVASIDTDADGVSRGFLSVISHEGHCLRRMTFEAPIECAPVIADVDGDNLLELLVADQAGWLHCFATRQIGPVEWGLFGGDSHNTRNAENAYRYGQVPAGVQWRWKPD